MSAPNPHGGGGVKLSAFVCALFATLCVAQAKTCVWTGAKGGDYLYTNAPENWQDGQMPVEGDTVVISSTSEAIICYTFKFSLENFCYTNTLGGTICAEGGGIIRVTGRDSEIVTARSTSTYLYVPIEVAGGGRLAFRLLTSDLSFAGASNGSDMLRGSGELLVTGAKTLNLRSHPNFHGTWNIEADVYVLPTSGGVTQLPFGADGCTVTVYGTNASDATQKGQLRFGGASEVAGTVSLFNKTSISTTYAAAGEDGIVTFRGDVYHMANVKGYSELALSCGIASANNRSGYVFLKDFACASENGIYPNMNIYTYSPGTFHLEVRGRFCPTTASNKPPSIGLFGGNNKADVRLGGPLSGGHSWKLALKSNQQFHLLAPEILPKGIFMVGYDAGTSENVSLDLHGHDQAISAIQTWGSGPHDIVVTSSDRPATLKVGNNESVTHVMPRLSGEISVYGYDIGYGSNGSLTFTNECDLTGWIGTEKNTLIFASEAKCPNLGGIECTGAGSVIVRNGATLNPDMTLDVHDVTGSGIRLATGVNLTVKHAFVEGVDLPAGTYCRTGAGIEGASEVDWLKKASTDTDDEMTGTVTVAEHDPVWIWTGKGSTSSFADPANWGANAAPDLADATLTLNFKNAAGQADATVPLDGTIAPAGAFNCGDFSKGAVTFGGAGTLVLGGTDSDLKMVFAESASLTWNGSGTLRLTGKSTSTGTLTVNSGTVVLDYAGWTGNVVVADGAELVVNASCGSEVFGAADAEANTCSIALAGKLTLGDDIAASVKALTINGQPVRYGKTYGSSDSAAVRTDDAHFGGKGTIVSYAHGGVLLIVR